MALMLPETLTVAEAPAFVARLSEWFRDGGAAPGEALVVDGSALKRFDSSALAVLLECRRQAARFGRAWRCQGLPGRLTDLATLYGIESLISSAA